MAVLRLIGSLIQRLLGRLIVIREERLDNSRVRHLFNNRVNEGIRKLAPLHGFERLGVESERFAFHGFTLYRDVWSNAELGIYLTTTDWGGPSYSFTTYFDDGTELITELPCTADARVMPESPQTLIYRTEGGFEANLTAHVERVRELEQGNRLALRTCSLRARVEQTRETYCSRMNLLALLGLLGMVWSPFNPTVGISLFFIFFVLDSPRLAPPPLLTPLQTGLTWMAVHGLFFYLCTKGDNTEWDPKGVGEALLEEFRSSSSTLPPSGGEAGVAQPFVALVGSEAQALERGAGRAGAVEATTRTGEDQDGRQGRREALEGEPSALEGEPNRPWAARLGRDEERTVGRLEPNRPADAGRAAQDRAGGERTSERRLAGWPSSWEGHGRRPHAEARPTPPARPLIKVRLKTDSSATHCPYCHDGIHEAGVACAECLAQHHGDCWDLHTRCSTCASPNGIVDQDTTDSAAPEATCCLHCHVGSDECTNSPGIGFLAASRRWSAGCCAPLGSSPGTGFLAASRRWSAGGGCCAPRGGSTGESWGARERLHPVLDQRDAAAPAPGPNRIVVRARATARPADLLQSPARLGAVRRDQRFSDEGSTDSTGPGSVAA